LCEIANCVTLTLIKKIRPSKLKPLSKSGEAYLNTMKWVSDIASKNNNKVNGNFFFCISQFRIFLRRCHQEIFLSNYWWYHIKFISSSKK